ncbi:MAG: SUMF1/EgtB/PvdO family nonheme iron enzyme [Rhodobacterales bacterium]|nr:SUMF1/EgtB/PvdO family nonheme iron enzyme [Rhodobacterales bacterium]
MRTSNRSSPFRAAVPALLVLLALAAGRAGAESPPRGAPFRDCEQCPEMVVIPAGTGVIGTDGGRPQEAPRHALRVDRPFALSRFEVTFDEWTACRQAGACAADPHDHDWGAGRRPVMNLTYADIGQYLDWLARKTGKPYRLPSEAEWEYAARGGTDTPFWWGAEAGKGRANCRKCGTPWSGKGSAPVGSFAANPFGLYDTAGNVWEWVADCWHPSHADAPAGTAPRLDGDCTQRVIKGGSWYYVPRNARPAFRHMNHVAVNSYNIGFRVARDLP